MCIKTRGVTCYAGGYVTSYTAHLGGACVALVPLYPTPTWYSSLLGSSRTIRCSSRQSAPGTPLGMHLGDGIGVGVGAGGGVSREARRQCVAPVASGEANARSARWAITPVPRRYPRTCSTAALGARACGQKDEHGRLAHLHRSRLSAFMALHTWSSSRAPAWGPRMRRWKADCGWPGYGSSSLERRRGTKAANVQSRLRARR